MVRKICFLKRSPRHHLLRKALKSPLIFVQRADPARKNGDESADPPDPQQEYSPSTHYRSPHPTDSGHGRSSLLIHKQQPTQNFAMLLHSQSAKHWWTPASFTRQQLLNFPALPPCSYSTHASPFSITAPPLHQQQFLPCDVKVPRSFLLTTRTVLPPTLFSTSQLCVLCPTSTFPFGTSACQGTRDVVEDRAAGRKCVSESAFAIALTQQPIYVQYSM